MKFFVVLLFAVSAPAESLHYSINWPSGLSLGEATLTSAHGSESWTFDLSVDASVPGFGVRDHEHSSATGDLCSIQLDKSYTHGQHKTEERITFDQQRQVILRGSPAGAKTETPVPACARDALTFLQFARRELADGRLAPQQQVVFGALYQVRLEYTGAQPVTVGDKRIDADRMVMTIKGPASDVSVELFIARDAARTPVLAKVPISLGTLTVELTP